MSSYLSKMTVKDLREISQRMNLTIPSRILKADLVALLIERIDGWHVIALDMNRSLHVDVPIVIDTVEVPMDHAQFTAWTVRRGGYLFDGKEAMLADHEEALQMDAKITSRRVYVAMIKGHQNFVKRFNPSMRRDRDGMVVLTAKQRRRVHKNDRKLAKRLGMYAKVS